LSKTWGELEEIQPVALKMIKNSLQKNRLAHAYLFEGIRGTGKRETGMVLAKSLFCLSLLEGCKPCEECTNCRRINHGNHPDIHVVEPDGMSIKKGQIQLLQEEFAKTGVESRQKLYMIIHADRMTVNAANSLLKFLEEPFQQTFAILVTEQVQKILPTILSRCQTISFQPLSSVNLQQRLIEAEIPEHMVPLISSLTNNLDEAIALNGDDWFAQAQRIVVKLFTVLKKNSLEALVSLQEEWFLHFKDKEQVDRGLNLLLLIFKDLLYIQIGKPDKIVFVKELALLEQLALKTSGRKLADQMTAILEAKGKLAANMNPQLLMEQLVLRLQEGS
jgi:DNA polymerase-3 subunit delta'